MGERDSRFPPHRTLDEAVAHSASRLTLTVELVWIPTPRLSDPAAALAGCAGVWAAPGTLASVAGALSGIRFAREQGIPFFGTCGGFQHAVLEFARNVLGFSDAAHEAYDPTAPRLILTSLACSIKGQAMAVRVQRGSRSYAAYGREAVTEEYYCSHGINPQYRGLLEEHGLRTAARDEDGEPRILEIDAHPFYVATLFVPQTRSTPGSPHPLITAFLAAAAAPGILDGRARHPS